jgi:uncharacterized iron-regulated membrane protein
LWLVVAVLALLLPLFAASLAIVALADAGLRLARPS